MKSKKVKVVSTKLKCGRTKSTSKSLVNNSQKAATNNIDINQSSSACGEDSGSVHFDCEADNACQFLLDGSVVKKKPSYEQSKEKELHSWELTKENICLSYAERFRILFDSVCINCSVVFEDRVIVCNTCGPLSTFCKSCIDDHHRSLVFHQAIEINTLYEISTYTFANKLCTRHHLQCPDQYSRYITVISTDGSIHQCEISFCLCSSEFKTLITYNLWPATPLKPNTVVSMDLLDTFIGLQMEGKISLTSFIDGLSWKNGVHNSDLKRILTRFMQTESIDQYRQFQREIRDIWFTNSIGKSFSQCPACPKDSGNLFYCMDANFGLVLKKSSSKSTTLPMCKDIFIPDQEVEEFMYEYDDKNIENKDCNNFQAGNHIRSKGKSSKLSVTGVFGMSCRHEIPKLFLNMRQGERLGYAVLMMDQIFNNISGKDLTVHMIYDIGCVLKKHLIKKQLLNKYSMFKFGVPIFHSYGHRADCQVENSIRRLDGFGLMDGELMERLWSYLRSFSKITKEMTPAHRVDFLSDALNHFTLTKLESLGKTLVGWYQKAKAILLSTSTELEVLSKGTGVNITDDVLHSWKKEEESKIKWKHVKTDDDCWESQYFKKLKEYFNVKTLLLLSSSPTDIARHKTKIKRLESTLLKVEKVNGVRKRWVPLSAEYKFYNKKYLENSSANTLDTLLSRANERLMLLMLKKRYSDGSAISNRLSNQVNKVCKDIKNLVECFNETKTELDVSFDSICYRDALDVNSVMYATATTVQANRNDAVPASVKSSCVQHYLRKCRAREELELVKSEMTSYLGYYESIISSMSQLNISTKGPIKAIIISKLDHFKETFQKSRDLFKHCLQTDFFQEDDIEFEVWGNVYSSDESSIDED